MSDKTIERAANVTQIVGAAAVLGKQTGHDFTIGNRRHRVWTTPTSTTLLFYLSCGVTELLDTVEFGVVSVGTLETAICRLRDQLSTLPVDPRELVVFAFKRGRYMLGCRPELVAGAALELVIQELAPDLQAFLRERLNDHAPRETAKLTEH